MPVVQVPEMAILEHHNADHLSTIEMMYSHSTARYVLLVSVTLEASSVCSTCSTSNIQQIGQVSVRHCPGNNLICNGNDTGHLVSERS